MKDIKIVLEELVSKEKIYSKSIESTLTNYHQFIENVKSTEKVYLVKSLINQINGIIDLLNTNVVINENGFVIEPTSNDSNIILLTEDIAFDCVKKITQYKIQWLTDKIINNSEFRSDSQIVERCVISARCKIIELFKELLEA